MKPSIPSSALDFKQMRTARVLLLFAVLAPLTGLLLPFVTLLGMWHAQRRPLLRNLGLALLSTGVLAGLAVAFGFESSPLSTGLSIAAVASFGTVCSSSPAWLALALWGENRPKWHPVGYSVAMVAGAASLPALALTVLGGAYAGLGLLASVVMLAFLIRPLLKGLPPIPELIPLAYALELEPTHNGWQGEQVFLGRRGQLTLKMPFPTRIPGLFASKRVQGVPATRPLLGDAVLDSTLELALPDSLMHLSKEPSLLLQAVHGAQAQVNEDGISLNRQLDKAAFKADPQAAMAQVQEELAAIAALHAKLSAS